MKTLTKRQNEVLEFLLGEQRAGRPTPTIQELTDHFGFSSTRASRDHLNALERKGVIQRDKHKARSIRVIDHSETVQYSLAVPLIGLIPAGNPDDRNQQGGRFIQIDRDSLGFTPTNKCFALKVAGDSMTGRGILDGDVVIVDCSMAPRDGDIVAALIDNECTLKTLIKRGASTFLRPENEKYPELFPIDELVIQGVIRTVIRNVC